jgi:hypothetical protein
MVVHHCFFLCTLAIYIYKYKVADDFYLSPLFAFFHVCFIGFVQDPALSFH